MTPQQIRNRQLASAGLPAEDYEPDLRDGDWIQVCELADQPPLEDRYVAFVVEVIEHGYYLLVECCLESGDTRRFELCRDGPPDVGVVSVKILRRVDRPAQPEAELGQIYGKRSEMRRTAHPRVEEIVPGARFRTKIDGYYTTVRILAANGRGWTAIDMATESTVDVWDRRRLWRLERCPKCGASDLHEVPLAGWPCLGCRSGGFHSKGGEQ